MLGVTADDASPALAGPIPGDGAPGVEWLDRLRESLAAIGATGGKDELFRLPPSQEGQPGIALIGLGPGPVTAAGLRYAAGSAARQIRGVGSLAFALPASTAEETLAILEGAALGAYGYDEYRSSSLSAAKSGASSIVVHAAVADDGLTARAAAAARAVHAVRDLVNMPASDLYPESFADRVRTLADDGPVAVEVLDEEALRAGGYGGILGVGQGSSRGPRLVKMSYAPSQAKRHLALVGKGITFDSGGLSLKPAASMVGMKYDMTGAATAMAVVLAAAELALPVRLTAWLCLAENLPSGTATRPGDVLRIRGGKTVEVLNTDAEGRLVLADGLVAAGEEHPDAIVDIATLTGAARVALGDRHTAVMGDDEFVARVIASAAAAGELFWHMPLAEELRAAINSDVADLANVRIGNTAGGMLLAGVFLREFVGPRSADDSRQIPWAHLDIAGTANNAGGGYGYTSKGPTGVAVRALLRLAEDLSDA